MIKLWIKFTATVTLLATLITGSGCNAKTNNDSSESVSNSSISSTENTNPTEPLKNETVQIENDDYVIADEIEDIFTKEEFEELVDEFSEPYIENKINVDEDDLEKFVAIVNIDQLSEENPEFARELFGNETKEEYVNDAAKVIGMTYMFNHETYTKENSTDNFIDVSTAVYDESQREKIEIIEDYVTRIALVVDNDDEVNKLVEELLIALNSSQGELSYLDDGVGFGNQVNIALILNSIARNGLNKENRDWLQTLTSSEKYVSNIFTQYEGCSSAYTKKLTK